MLCAPLAGRVGEGVATGVAPAAPPSDFVALHPDKPLRRLRARPNLLKQINLIWAVQSPLQKYFASPVGQIISTNSRHPTPQEGRIMIVTNAGWVAVDAAAFCARWDRRAGRKTCERSTARGREMLQRTAKSCGPDAPTLASSSRSLSRPNRA